MNPTHPEPTRPSRESAHIRFALVIAGLMLAVPVATKLATRGGWFDGAEVSRRALMVLVAVLIVFIGNSIPKRPAHRVRHAHAEQRVHAFFRFAGWTWVLAGLGLGLAWTVLTPSTAETATVLLMPVAILLIAFRSVGLCSEDSVSTREREPAADEHGSRRDVAVSASSRPAAPTPANYAEVEYWKITDGSGRLIQLNLLALPLAAVSGVVFFWAAQQFGSTPGLPWRAQEGVVFVVGLFVVLALHEWVHGALMRINGARPRYGFFLRGGMFYAKAPGYAFTRQQYLVVVLGPLVILSLVAIGGMSLLAGTSMVSVMALWGIVNASSASADVSIAALLLKYPSVAHVVDEPDGLRILVPSGDTRPR